jgi:hypothetical protein
MIKGRQTEAEQIAGKYAKLALRMSISFRGGIFTASAILRGLLNIPFFSQNKKEPQYFGGKPWRAPCSSMTFTCMHSRNWPLQVHAFAELAASESTITSGGGDGDWASGLRTNAPTLPRLTKAGAASPFKSLRRARLIEPPLPLRARDDGRRPRRRGAPRCGRAGQPSLPSGSGTPPGCGLPWWPIAAFLDRPTAVLGRA